MVNKEEVEGTGVEMPKVRWILPRRRVGVVRSLDVDLCSMPGDAMNFFHRAGNRLDMLDHVNHPDAVKAVVWERVGKLVQIMNHVDPFQGCDVQPNASRPFMFPATNIQNLCVQRQFFRACTEPDGVEL